MKKGFTQKHLIAGICCAMALACGARAAYAAQPETGMSPALFQRMMLCIGLSATTQPGPDKAFPALVTVEGINNAWFAVGFPAGGLKRNAPFYLATDDGAGLVQLSDAGGLSVIAGDVRPSGILDALACILTTIALMVAEILTAALTLNILGILSAVLNGVVGLLSCIFSIVI
jgi:hypothetical protein